MWQVSPGCHLGHVTSELENGLPRLPGWAVGSFREPEYRNAQHGARHLGGPPRSCTPSSLEQFSRLWQLGCSESAGGLQGPTPPPSGWESDRGCPRSTGGRVAAGVLCTGVWSLLLRDSGEALAACYPLHCLRSACRACCP